MTISYPDLLDGDTNLYLVRDAVRFVLLEDYEPGDRTIAVDGDPVLWGHLPATGIVTLTDQCSDLDDRAVSFRYSKDTAATGMVLVVRDAALDAGIIAGFADVVKPRRRTNVVMNVMSDHHNQIKNAIIAIERFVGIRGTVDPLPLGSTMEGRVNFLRKLVLSPKAYFSADRKIGLVPLTVNFQDLSFRLGADGTTGPIAYHWDFGDGTVSNVVSQISAISTDPIVTGCDSHELVEVTATGDQVGGRVEKTYCEPGIYDVTLTVSNDFGSDTIRLSGLIQARVEAPEGASIQFVPDAATQLATASPLRIRTPINTLIAIQVPDGENLDNPGFSYAGERLTGGGVPIDAVTRYTWGLSDDLTHSSVASATRASYSVGGLYDVKLRVDTANASFRITTFAGAIDVVERQNLWMFLLDAHGTLATPHEYGLLGGTFKVGAATLAVARDESFLTGQYNAAKQKAEFRRNAGFAPAGSSASGGGGSAVLFYASGRAGSAAASTESIRLWNFNAFAQTFQSLTPIARPWNWASFSSATHSYFLLGGTTAGPAANTSPTNPVLHDLNLGTGSATGTTWTSGNFLNGSDELLTNAGYENGQNFDQIGAAIYGDYSVYRTAWKDSQGFLLRNEAAGNFFRIRSFYSTVGTAGVPVASMTKLQDMPGPVKLEGQFVPLSSGLYFFNNTGAISVYGNTTSTWETGGPGVNSASFRSLQDQTAASYDEPANRLLCASDGDRRAYLSFDYSTAAFVKFNSVDLTFSSLLSRPAGTQWLMGIY